MSGAIILGKKLDKGEIEAARFSLLTNALFAGTALVFFISTQRVLLTFPCGMNKLIKVFVRREKPRERK